MKRSIQNTYGHSRIDGVIPGMRGQRAFPNKELKTFDPFVMLDHIGPQKIALDYFLDGTNSAHPHRGFETITFLFEGVMHHKDSLGNQVKLSSGSVQSMNAGSGIQHGGDFERDPDKDHFHEVQLWVNLPASQKFSEPHIQNATAQDIPVIENPGLTVRVIAGELLGIQGPITPIADVKIVHIIGQREGHITVDNLPQEYNLMVYALSGEWSINGKQLSAYQSMVFNNDGDEIDLKSLEDGELLILAGQAIGESVVMGGPFVMNTQEEIEEAFEDFKDGKFGNVVA